MIKVNILNGKKEKIFSAIFLIRYKVSVEGREVGMERGRKGGWEERKKNEINRYFVNEDI